uniref:Uncharacterized protein n=1 Tax=Kalanchoe fedtschenkoi TaxID=63787 RepID=A0A7N0UHI6_KALFE
MCSKVQFLTLTHLDQTHNTPKSCFKTPDETAEHIAYVCCHTIFVKCGFSESFEKFTSLGGFIETHFSYLLHFCILSMSVWISWCFEWRHCNILIGIW